MGLPTHQGQVLSHAQSERQGCDFGGDTGREVFLRVTACVFSLIFNEAKCLSGRKTERNCVGLKVKGAGIGASRPPQ